MSHKQAKVSTRRSKTVVVDNSDVTIAVMGASGTGKTTFINMASGSSLRVGRGLQSCTSVVQVAQPFTLNGRSVTLVDTPGFDDTTKSDIDILRMIGTFLAADYENGKKLSGVIYVHRISDVRMGGTSTRNFKMFRQLCGENAMKNVMIVTNRWGDVALEVGEEREAELISQVIFFKPVLDMGALIMRHNNTVESTRNVISKIIKNTPLPLQIQHELVEEKKDIIHTAAGEELNRELNLRMEKHRNEMEKLQEEMQEAIRTKDEEGKRELEIETRRLQAEIDKVQAVSQKFVSENNEEMGRRQKAIQLLAISESARQAAAEENRRIGPLPSHNQQNRPRTSLSSSSTADSVRQRHELQRTSQYGERRDEFFTRWGRKMDALVGPLRTLTSPNRPRSTL